jgi:hypothetical protein
MVTTKSRRARTVPHRPALQSDDPLVSPPSARSNHRRRRPESTNTDTFDGGRENASLALANPLLAALTTSGDALMIGSSVQLELIHHRGIGVVIGAPNTVIIDRLAVWGVASHNCDCRGVGGLIKVESHLDST